jgi:hypothetical protein
MYSKNKYRNICNNCKFNNRCDFNIIAPWICKYDDKHQVLIKNKEEINIKLSQLKEQERQEIETIECIFKKNKDTIWELHKKDIETHLFGKTVTKKGEKSSGFYQAIPHDKYCIEGGYPAYKSWWKGLKYCNELDKIDQKKNNEIREIKYRYKEKKYIYLDSIIKNN